MAVNSHAQIGDPMAELPRRKGEDTKVSHSSRPEQSGQLNKDIQISPVEQIEKWQQVFGPRMLIICRKYNCRNEEEDILQEVWLSAFSWLVRGEVVREPGPWLSTLTRNKCVALKRSCQQRIRRLEQPE